MKKNVFFAMFFTILTFLSYSEGTENQKKFVSGNLQDKTNSVRSATGNEAKLLANEALDFVIQSKDILGNDRNLDALALSGILALPSDYMETSSEDEKKHLADNFLEILNKFSDANVLTSVLNRLTVFDFKDERFTARLNDYLKKAEIKSDKDSLTKSVIQTLGSIGDENSFVILYLLYGDPVWTLYKDDLKSATLKLMEKSVPQILSIIQTGNDSDLNRIFSLVQENKNFSNKILSDISENVLSRSIYIYENNLSESKNYSDLIDVQFESFEVLVKLRWTRANKTAINFFKTAKKEYENGIFPSENFSLVITDLPSIAPVEAVQSFCSYLNECNSLMESSISDANVKKPDEKIVLALISALGAIGDKNAFDTLLAVTYFSYSDNVIQEARNALSSLKW